VTVSGTNVIYGGCTYPMSGSSVTILGNTYLVGPGGVLILTSSPSTGGTTTTVTGYEAGPTGSWFEHHAAYDATARKYLLVVQAGYNGDDLIWGQFFDENGVKVQDRPFVISVGSGYKLQGLRPRVAASGDGRFLVSYTGVPQGARIVQAVEYDGGVLVGAPVTVATGTTMHWGDVAWVPQTQRFLVTWTKFSPVAPGEQEVWAMSVSWDGNLGTARQITQPAPDQLSPLTNPSVAVGADGNMMVVGWRDCTGTAWAGKCGIYRTRIDANGVPISPTEHVVYGPYSVYASVVFNPVAEVYQVFWINKDAVAGGQIHGMRYALNGTPLEAVPFLVASVDRLNLDPYDDSFNQLSSEYDPATNQYMLALRGEDPPNGGGLAPVLRVVAGADGRAVSPAARLDQDSTNSPWPTVVSDGVSKAFVFYNYRYASAKVVAFPK
jgi:hypothetical protein